MTVFILSFLVLVSLVAAMSVGVLFGRKPIKGSCGGMSSLGMGTACDICGGDTTKCDEEQERQQQFDGHDETLAYNVGTNVGKNVGKSGAGQDDTKN